MGGDKRQTLGIHTGYDEYLNRSQVAHLFNVSPSTITRWAEEGKLAHVRTLGGHRRYAAEDILELVRTLSKERRMQTFTTEIPRLFGDHHVSAVHGILAGLTGIQEVTASAAAHQVEITFDPDLITSETILTRLAAQGYPPRNGLATGGPAGTQKDPAWAQTQLRMTQTHPADK